MLVLPHFFRCMHPILAWKMPHFTCPSPHLNPLLCVSPSDFSSPSHFLEQMPTYVYKYRRRYGRRWSRYRRYGAYSRYRRRRSGTSSTASSRGRIRVRVPVQQVVSLTFPANSIDSNVLTSSPFYRDSSTAPLLSLLLSICRFMQRMLTCMIR